MMESLSAPTEIYFICTPIRVSMKSIYFFAASGSSSNERQSEISSFQPSKYSYPGLRPPAGAAAAVRGLFSDHRPAPPPRPARAVPEPLAAPGPAGSVRVGAALGAGLPQGGGGLQRPLPGGAVPGAGPGRDPPRRRDPLPAGADVAALPLTVLPLLG